MLPKGRAYAASPWRDSSLHRSFVMPGRIKSGNELVTEQEDDFIDQVEERIADQSLAGRSLQGAMPGKTAPKRKSCGVKFEETDIIIVPDHGEPAGLARQRPLPVGLARPQTEQGPARQDKAKA